MPLGSGKSRTNGGRSHSRDARPPRVASSLKIQDQLYWRRNCLKERLLLGTLTDKNLIEANHIGMRLTKLESGKIVGVSIV
jgi:hypothetical protein